MLNKIILELQESKYSDNAIQKCLSVISTLDFAFQPIVDIHSGICYGYEALLRNYQQAGFISIGDFFDWAFHENILYHADMLLREKAINKFLEITHHQGKKIFYNLDNRVLEMSDYSPGNTEKILNTFGLEKEAICFEVSERHKFDNFLQIDEVMSAYKQQSYLVAIDDFGAGYSNLQLLYHIEPDFVKMDRFFVSGIGDDPKKKLFVSNFVQMAHVMGILVVAEGVETEEEFRVCRDIGCDMVQGYYVARPTIEIDSLLHCYEHIMLLGKKDRRQKGDSRLLKNWITNIPPLPLSGSTKSLLNLLKNSKEGIIPIVKDNCEPVGIISEKGIKSYAYSPYGLELLNKQVSEKNLKSLISECPLVDIKMDVERILEIFSMRKESEGLIITEHGKYLGFLDARSLLNAVNEKNVAEAKDQNPLTRLPGNFAIQEYLYRAVENVDSKYLLLYLDIDNFKPFNDRYGFRRGDRVLLLLSQLLQKIFSGKRFFIGHIGGDDFFLGICDGSQKVSQEKNMAIIGEIVNSFAEDVSSLYDSEDASKGYILSRGRNNQSARFPLMTVSAAVLELPVGLRSYTIDEISFAISKLKKVAKTSPDHIAYTAMCNLPGGGCDYGTINGK